MRSFGVLVILSFGTSLILCGDLNLEVEWKQLDFEFPSSDVRESAIANGDFVQANCVPIDVDVDYRNDSSSRIFVSIPRFTTGIPVTLGHVNASANGTGNPIQPNPDYSWHTAHGSNCDNITSVFRVTIDNCHNMWVLDTGKIGDTVYCQPQILRFDLKTDELLSRYRFPVNQTKKGASLFISIALDVKDEDCSNVTAYMTDVNGYAILMYDLQENASWRAQNKLAYPVPEYGTHTIANQTFDLMDGNFGIVLSPANKTVRKAYFHALASNTENSVPLEVLNNQTMWNENVDSEPRKFITEGYRPSQAASKAMDRNGNLFYGLEDPIVLACWDSDKPFTTNNTRILVKNDTTLQFASGMKIRENQGEQSLWVLTSRFQKVMTGTINSDEINFRIQTQKVDTLLDGDSCLGNSTESSK